MNDIKKTFFISDLHLEESRPQMVKKFIELLSICKTSAEALYILGDFFEVWIGDDEISPFHTEIKTQLKTATQNGLRIYFMSGNRDFLIGKKFIRETGCILLKEEEKISLYGTSVLLMHGDTLCTQDHAYLKARKFAYNPLVQWLFLKIPLAYRKKIANNLRMKSLRHTQTTPKIIMDVTQEEVERVMKKHQSDYLIHGHTHRPMTHHFTINGRSATRQVLAAWHESGNAFIWDETGEKNAIEF